MGTFDEIVVAMIGIDETIFRDEAKIALPFCSRCDVSKEMYQEVRCTFVLLTK